MEISDKSYIRQGYTSNSPELPLHTVSDPITVKKGWTWKIWYAEDFLNDGEWDNSGTVKADVYAIII